MLSWPRKSANFDWCLPSLANFNSKITKGELRRLVDSKNLVCLQTTEPLPKKTARLINNELLVHRPDVNFRTYSGDWDLAFLSEMPDLRRFSVDCAFKIDNLEALSNLPNLEKLTVGGYQLESFAFLIHVNPDITELGLHQTFSKKPRIDLISRFPKLKVLYLEGQQKPIEAISTLQDLEDLTLRSISTPDLKYLLPLTKLKQLDIKLGGIKDFSALAEMPQLTYLEIWLVRKFADLSFLEHMVGLEKVFLQSLSNVTELPNLSRLTNLTKLTLMDMKGLRDLAPILSATSLEDFAFIDQRYFKPRDFESILDMPSLKEVNVGFGGLESGFQFIKMTRARGLRNPFDHPSNKLYE